MWLFAVLFPNPSTDCCLVKRRAMENFVVILMGTSLVTSYKTVIIHLHIRAALVLKKSLFRSLLSWSAAG